MDRHLRLLDHWSRALAARFPEGGIAVAGSVGAGRHGPASDLDLLVADRSARRARQTVAVEDRVRVNVVCVHPERWAALLDEDAFRFAAIRSSYVLGARVLRDPHGLVASLQASARAVRARREHEPAALLAVLRGRAADALARADEPRPGPRTRRALSLLVEGALLRAGRTAADKREGRRPFEALAHADPVLHGMAAALLRHGAPPRETLRAAFAYVFPPGASGSEPRAQPAAD